MSREASDKEKQRLLAQMDVTMIQKLAFASAHFQLHDGAKILDLGCARGLSSYQLALMNPRLQVVGLDYDGDYIKSAKQEYNLPNLSYIQGDARDLDGVGEYDAILNSSMMHEVSSFSGYGQAPVEEALQSQLKALKTGGVIMLRDFMRPAVPSAMVYLDIPAGEKGAEHIALLQAYAEHADREKPENERGFLLEKIGVLDDGWTRFYLSHDRAFEYIWRKEYAERFDIETREKYGVWTADQYRDVPERNGARVVYTAPYRNPWIKKNWHDGQFRLFDQDMKPLQAPPSNFIAVIQKTDDDKSIRLYEHKTDKDAPSYLKMSHHVNQDTGQIFDLVKRPGAVYDVIPYMIDNEGAVRVIAKSGYPRPLVNIQPRQMTPNIDGRTWSGHMVEPLAVATNDRNDDSAHARVTQTLIERAGFTQEQIGDIEMGLQYYPAVADVNEHVTSYFVPVTGAPYEANMSGKFSNFSHDGSIRTYHLQDLLRGVQVGMLPEARLEMSLYELLRKTGQSPLPWIGNNLDIATVSLNAQALQEPAPVSHFVETSEGGNYLRILRSVFNEEARGANGAQTVLKSTALEFAVPSVPQDAAFSNISTNGAVLLPLLKNEASGDVMVGIHVKNFPSVQEWDGQSNVMSLPGVNIPATVKNTDQLQDFIAAETGIASKTIQPLGESYFPSMGIVPNRVYPYVISDPSLAARDDLVFVPLREAFENLDMFKDANMIIALLRATHALDVWDDYKNDLKSVPNPKPQESHHG